MAKEMTADDVRDILREKVGANASAWGRAAGISAAYVSEVLSRRREPGEKVLQALGLERVVTYRRAES